MAALASFILTAPSIVTALERFRHAVVGPGAGDARPSQRATAGERDEADERTC